MWGCWLHRGNKWANSADCPHVGLNKGGVDDTLYENTRIPIQFYYNDIALYARRTTELFFIPSWTRFFTHICILNQKPRTSFIPCFYFLRNKLELRLPTLIIEILSNKPFDNFQRLLYIDRQLLHSFYILCGGLINHALKDKSRMHIWIVNMRSLTALVHRKRQQHCLRQWMNGSWPEYSRMNLWNPQHAQTICLLSRKLNHTLLSLPPSMSAIPFHHVLALQVWWQISTLKATSTVCLIKWGRKLQLRGASWWGIFSFYIKRHTPSSHCHKSIQSQETYVIHILTYYCTQQNLFFPGIGSNVCWGQTFTSIRVNVFFFIKSNPVDCCLYTHGYRVIRNW